LLFISDVCDKSDVITQLLSLEATKGTTGKVLYEALSTTLEQYDLSFDKVISIITNG
jgi:hypothetical protein